MMQQWCLPMTRPGTREGTEVMTHLMYCGEGISSSYMYDTAANEVGWNLAKETAGNKTKQWCL